MTLFAHSALHLGSREHTVLACIKMDARFGQPTTCPHPKLDVTSSDIRTMCRTTSYSSIAPSLQYMAVMRHSRREDESNENWVPTAGRPWDPPISEEGVELVQVACQKLQAYTITKVATSPFRRCIDTAQLACSALNLPSNTIEVDWQLSEVLTEKLLNGHVWHIPHERISQWMWQNVRDGGTPNNEGVHDKSASGVPGLCVNASSAPGYPETLEAGHARYSAALQDIADRHRPNNVLVVTHGEAVRQSVMRGMPWATVFRVDHCGFIMSCRGLDEDSEWDWKVEEQQESRGVSWTA